MKPEPIKLSEKTLPELHGILMTLTRAIEDAGCPDCSPPPEVFQARENVEDEIASRGI